MSLGSFTSGFTVGGIFGLLAAVAAAVLFPAECEAAQLTHSQAESTYIVAYGQYTGPPEWLEQRPAIHLVSRSVVCASLNLRPDCGAKAAYVPGNVFIDETLDFSDVLVASILLHEFIHHFQWLKNGDTVSEAMKVGDVNLACRRWMANEAEAYGIQAYVLAQMKEHNLARQHDKLSKNYLNGTDSCPPTVES